MFVGGVPEDIIHQVVSDSTLTCIAKLSRFRLLCRSFDFLAHKLWKENLSKDGQQFDKYQQNERSHITLTRWIQSRGPATYNAGNPGPGLRYTQKYGEKEGKQFHKYQQNERSHITLTCLTQRSGPSTYDIGNSGPGLGHAHTYGDLSRLLWSQPHPLDKDFYIIRCYNILTRKPI